MTFEAYIRNIEAKTGDLRPGTRHGWWPQSKTVTKKLT
jgi:hypothetical protein